SRSEWKSIEDLNPFLTEFDLRYAGQDYFTAAAVLSEIDFNYLMLWGYFLMVAKLYEKLNAKLNDPSQKIHSANLLGVAYYRLGKFQKAIDNFEIGLEIADEIGDHQSKGALFVNLGNCYVDSGDIDKSIEYYKQSLAVYEDSGLISDTATVLNNLGNRYTDMGKFQRAIKYYKKAIAIANDYNDKASNCLALNNIGVCYGDLGQDTLAFEYTEQALNLARQIGDRLIESAALCFKGIAYNNLGEFNKAEQLLTSAIRIADDINWVTLQNEARGELALNHLYTGNLIKALVIIKDAYQYDLPTCNHRIRMLFGVIKLREGDLSTAQQAFTEAIKSSDLLLAYSAKNYKALDIKGLALLGLVLCGNQDYLQSAIECFKAARNITKEDGIVREVLNIIDEFPQTHQETNKMLQKVRIAAAGS
ncbi:MAG: tetratricopeptide repeat protein, partial [Promethearchaeia archaeon]